MNLCRIHFSFIQAKIHLSKFSLNTQSKIAATLNLSLFKLLFLLSTYYYLTSNYIGGWGMVLLVSVCDLVFPLGYKLHVNRDVVSFVSAAPSVCRRVFGTK